MEAHFYAVCIMYEVVAKRETTRCGFENVRRPSTVTVSRPARAQGTYWPRSAGPSYSESSRRTQWPTPGYSCSAACTTVQLISDDSLLPCKWWPSLSGARSIIYDDDDDDGRGAAVAVQLQTIFYWWQQCATSVRHRQTSAECYCFMASFRT